MSRDGTIARTPDGGYVLQYERVFEKTTAQVWAALTEPKILVRWMARSDVDLRVGGEFVIYFFEGKETMRGTILALERERLIEYSWIEDGAPPSRVRWTIAPDGAGACRLILSHILPPGSTSGLVIELGGGWHGILDFLKTALDGGTAVYDESARRAREKHYATIFEQRGDA